MTFQSAQLTATVLLLLFIVAGCSDSSDTNSNCAIAQREPATVLLDSHDYAADPEVTTLDGTIVVVEHYDNGHIRQLGISIEPTPDTFWKIEGREYVWLMDGTLTRLLEEHVGETVRVNGVIRSAHSFLRTIAPRSVELPDGIVVTPPPQQIVMDSYLEGRVVVLERHADGHPAVLGITNGECAPIAFDDTNKSRELVYRVGRTMRVDGAVLADNEFTVVSYSELEGSPEVASGDGFRLSFLAGGLDENGKLMGGVEVDALLAFDGRIFAGTSYSQNTQQESPDPFPPGAQVLVLDKPDGRWRVELQMPDDTDGSKSKIKFLDIVRFETDHAGTRLDPPVEMLAAVAGNGEVYLRGPGESGKWYETGVSEVVRAASDPGRRPDARSIVAHTDAVSGISYLFAGVGIGRRSGVGGGIYKGSYDSSLPGLITWQPEAELPIADGPRPMGLAEIAGSVYASVGPRLLRREDGPDPTWTEVLFYLNPFRPDSVRRATGIEGPDGGSSLLVGIENVAGAVVRVDLDNADALTEELSLNTVFPGNSYTIVAYNGPATRTMEDGTEAALLGLEMNRIRTTAQPAPEAFDLGGIYEFTDGLFLWRNSKGNYWLNRIDDPRLELPPPLVAPRTILSQSPFAGEENVIYLGGFDHNGNLFHNTGWIYKVHLDDILRGAIPVSSQAQAQAQVAVGE